MALGAVLGAALVGACGLEMGGPALGGDGGGPDGTMGDGAAFDAGADGFMTPDLGTGETESGAACVCTDPLPDMSWHFVAYDGTGRPACPMQYGTPSDVLENATAPAAQCTCQCNGVAMQPACGGNVAFTYGFGGSNQCNSRTGTVTCGTGCTAGGGAGAGGDAGDSLYLSFMGSVTASGGSCNSPTTAVGLPDASAQQGRDCSLAGALGSCMGGLACAPDPGSMFALCIAKAGTNPCPSGYPNPHVVGAGLTDTRGCGPSACTCSLNPGSCSTPDVHAYWAVGCPGGSEFQNGPRSASGACVTTSFSGVTAGIQSCYYTSTNMGASCTFTGTFAADGGVALTGPQTICCR